MLTDALSCKQELTNEQWASLTSKEHEQRKAIFWMDYCVLDDCLEHCTTNCKVCDGDFCRKHYDENHKKGRCNFD